MESGQSVNVAGVDYITRIQSPVFFSQFADDCLPMLYPSIRVEHVFRRFHKEFYLER